MDEKALRRKIRAHNEKVDYNRSAMSWVVDIIASLIFFPMIVLVIYRRGKYNDYMRGLDEWDKRGEGWQ